MARGWESKSVEAQQAEAAERPSKPQTRLSPEKASRARQQESVRLARQRVLQQLEKSRNPKHRQLLESELADLEDRLKRSAG